MKCLEIYDPAMCCSSGVCGPSVDPQLSKLAADVAFLKSRGINMQRFNLAHQADQFATNPVVLAEMGVEAEHLPLFIIDGVIRKGRYPRREDVAGLRNRPRWRATGIAVPSAWSGYLETTAAESELPWTSRWAARPAKELRDCIPQARQSG